MIKAIRDRIRYELASFHLSTEYVKAIRVGNDRRARAIERYSRATQK